MRKKSTKEADIKDFAKKIDDLKKLNKDLEGNWKRALADYQNLKRRSDQDRIEIVKYANENLMREVVTVLGNFDLLLEHNQDPGLKITVTNFLDILKRNGLQEIDLTGKKFDVDLAEAVETCKGKKGFVVKTLEKGYSYNGKVIKPTKVVVGKD